MSTPDELGFVFMILEDSFKAHLNIVAATAWVAYDMLIMFDQEVKHIWRHKMSLPSMIYIIARYYGLMYMIYTSAVDPNDHLTDELCKGYTPFKAAGVLLLSTIANFLLARRIHAFYNRGKMVAIVLIILFLVELTAEVGFTVVTVEDAGPSYAHPGGLPITGCSSGSVPRFDIASWVINITYQLLLFTMGSFRLFQLGRTNDFRSELTVILVRDGALYFVMMCLANLVNIILNHVVKTPLLGAGVPWMMAAFSVGTSRIIISLRGASDASLPTSEDAPRSRALVFARTEESRNTASGRVASRSVFANVSKSESSV